MSTDAPTAETNSTEAALPAYTRSLLKVSLPVRVQLAEKKEKVKNVVEMGPGTILTFTKRCDEPLELFVDNQPIAVGEAVKLGDKFGFRIHEITLPSEHFYLVRRKAEERVEGGDGEDASVAEEAGESS
ncbi:MAG: FliM/FliN family flagellar motor switch protein [Lacipirellulaceae bacterium]